MLTMTVDEAGQAFVARVADFFLSKNPEVQLALTIEHHDRECTWHCFRKQYVHWESSDTRILQNNELLQHRSILRLQSDNQNSR